MTLREIRLFNKLTQCQVADAINVDRTTYIKIEKGQAQLKVDALPKLCKLFNINDGQLLEVYFNSKTKEYI